MKWSDDSTFANLRQATTSFNQMVDNKVLLVTLNLMVENRLDATFRALADPTRRGMLASLARGDKSVGELGEPFSMTFAGASKHLKVLESAGLVERRKAGRKQICTLKAEPLAEAERWLKQWERFWTVRLDLLQALVENQTREKPNA
ncbi:MAG: ArsR/SmtB family transcription factor [Sphingomicrobium sp.]